LTKYAVTAILELPEIGMEFVYDKPNAAADASYPPTLIDYSEANEGYFIMY